MLLRLPLWGWPARGTTTFADGYGRSLADDPTTVAVAELRLVAATLMRVRAGLADRCGDPDEAAAATRRSGVAGPVNPQAADAGSRPTGHHDPAP